ncbi:MAG: hypothetical protein ACOX25_09850 [Caldicoprobacterales bacterium]|jgi:galactose mutarotase-like enzyme|nr:hypothetical protein [Clostridiales bacterium]
MKQLIISGQDGSTKATILPDYGGMVSSLRVRGNEILRMKPEMLGLGNCLAGGIPVLFPFCGKTKDDTYILNGKTYTMPFHGFMKDSTFSVGSVKPDEVTLYSMPGEVVKKENYPFDFVLTLKYRIEGSTLFIRAIIENNSQENMPFYIGWHPYFRTTDKKQTSFTFDFKHYQNYLDGSLGEWRDNTVDLTQTLDHVFWGIGKHEMILQNRADGYIAKLIPDELHRVVTICTIFDDCACIEPWTGSPNSINTGKFVNYVSPGSSVECGFNLNVETL